jgi:hypothetical protein
MALNINQVRSMASEKELQGKYEQEALDELMTFDSKKIDKCGRYMIRMRNLQASGDMYIVNPEGGDP